MNRLETITILLTLILAAGLWYITNWSTRPLLDEPMWQTGKIELTQDDEGKCIVTVGGVILGDVTVAVVEDGVVKLYDHYGNLQYATFFSFDGPYYLCE